MKYKKIPKDYIKICVDRLTRFKPVYEKYERVFSDILNKFLICTPEDLSEKEHLCIENFCAMAVEIFNNSIPFEFDPTVSKLIYEEELNTYYTDENQKKYLDFGLMKLNLTGAIKYIKNEDNLPLNLKRLATFYDDKELTPSLNFLREKYGFLYPIQKVILTEGATEEILLSKFAGKLGYDFNKEGVTVIGAGGKNQVARKYYRMVNEVKLPVFILLDFDADETKELIMSKKRDRDKIYLIKNGEFEDILTLDLIINAINHNFSNNLRCTKDDFDKNLKMTKNLHNLFKNKGFGEYKKADFAKMVKNYLECDDSDRYDIISQDIIGIINEIKAL